MRHGWWLITDGHLVLSRDGRFGELALPGSVTNPRNPPEARITEKEVHWFPDQSAAQEYLRVIWDARGHGFRFWFGRWEPCTLDWFLTLLYAEHLADLFRAERAVVERDMDTEAN